MGALAVVADALYAGRAPCTAISAPSWWPSSQRQLGPKLAIGHLDVHKPGRIVMDQVAIAANRKLAQGALLRAKQVVIVIHGRT